MSEHKDHNKHAKPEHHGHNVKHDGDEAKPAGQPEQSSAPAPAPSPASSDAPVLDAAGGEQAQVAKLEADLRSANDQTLRARAELANYQKRVERDRQLSTLSIKRDFIKGLLPSLDALNLAIRHSGAEGGALLEGVKAARDAFESALVAQGAERIRSTGSWDPDLHHPQASIERADLPDGSIIEEIRPGYKVGSLVARHSEVVVSKRPAEKPKSDAVPPAAPPPEKKPEGGEQQ